MKDKEMIEEMAKVMADCNITCNECFEQFESTLTMKIKNRAEHCQAYMFAKRAIEKGWGKIGEDSVVLSKEEKQEYENLVKLLIYDKPIKSRVYEFIVETKEQARKETAEKILRDFKLWAREYQYKDTIIDDKGERPMTSNEKLNYLYTYLCDKYNVEIKE